jgi:hypothetical protein
MAGIPMWGWTAIAAAGAIVLVMWFKNKGSKAAPTLDTSTLGQAGGIDTQQYETLLAQIRALQGESETVPPKPKPGDEGSGDKSGDTTFHTNGKQSLNAIATSHHTSAAQIIETTKKHHGITSAFNAYVRKHRFTAHVPTGITLWIPETEAAST